ncbi:hypothetical protein EHI8A_098700 [Entamoeba histolytica HM-1:IMSS-B]|uniref:Uncharacterized protein n=4 Tax=Entamoeba histolytica TaxID=5759 RepID=C4M9U2_ENTH1|nr:hypothetical protein EHI_108460 [Entamoeba histolytica HM-1:IMSS]EAL44145.2 hypothetical protein EHI_108460 [Entamoeba histolytica HM-1:IMSS]EMH73702.1 hypothetical protein EHI8A_098700 [Entamoeba histolytica HM-1:IMSS-B]ENY60470.1 hypothetical protein EHI7A_094700 [Entamoeba histolytica HM-1:IMSS-A]GAT98491.1 hypothetical protein CL6EHI_108460 [Entamoeba histolytica]|eukprot:XP_649533.2 hypothetical protein EHI_108460 [Entamoeba histolytica HM-1:IMSS]
MSKTSETNKEINYIVQEEEEKKIEEQEDWKNIVEEWKEENNEIITINKEQNKLFFRYLSLIQNSVYHRFALFQIEDSIKHVSHSQNEYFALFWRCIKEYCDDNSEIRNPKALEIIPLQLPSSIKINFSFEIKQIKNKLIVEFNSSPILFHDGEFPANCSERHNSIQNIFNGELAVLNIPIHKGFESSIQLHLKSNLKYDIHYGGYEYQIKHMNIDNMKVGDMFLTMHSNMYYNVVIHSFFNENNAFQFGSNDKSMVYYSNLIFKCHQMKASSLFFVLDDIGNENLIEQVMVEMFTNIRQSLINEGFTTLKTIGFICSEEITSQTTLKTFFTSKIHVQ